MLNGMCSDCVEGARMLNSRAISNLRARLEKAQEEINTLMAERAVDGEYLTVLEKEKAALVNEVELGFEVYNKKCVELGAAVATAFRRGQEELARMLEAYCRAHGREMLEIAKTRQKDSYDRPLFLGRADIYQQISSLLCQPDYMDILRKEVPKTPCEECK